MNEIVGMKLIGWQNKAARIFESLEQDDIFVIKSSRQKGKSTFLCQVLLYVALNRPGSESYIISPTNNQCRKIFNDVKNICVESPLVTKLNESTQEILFINNSKIYFRSAESRDNLRGNTVRNGGVLLIDETCFIKDDTLAILLPYTTVAHANIIAVSTPRRKNGTFYNWYVKALNKVKNFKYIDVNDFDNSFFITNEQIDMYKSIMPPEKFKNEILGVFTSLDEGVFGDFTKNYFNPKDLEPVYVGIDWSTTGEDETVISAFNKNYQQCFIWRDKDLEPLERCKKIAEILNNFKMLKKVIVEKNSIGSVYASLLKSIYNKPNIIEEFVTSNTSKRDIIETMISKLGKQEITILNDEAQNYQLSIYVQQPLKNGGYTYNADPLAQNSHDDIIMATAFAIKAFSSKSGNYVFGSSSYKKTFK